MKGLKQKDERGFWSLRMNNTPKVVHRSTDTA